MSAAPSVRAITAADRPPARTASRCATSSTSSGRSDVAEPPLPVVEGVAVEHRWVALADGTRLHLAEAGPADAPPLVLVHGWPQHWWAWRRVLPALARERRVICPDLRGLGWSDAPPGAYTKEGWATDLLGLLDALGLDRADLVGHDWGGLAVLLAALRAPERVRSAAAVSIVHPWPRAPAPSPRTLVPLAYQIPLAVPVAGAELLARLPVLVRELIRRGSGPGHRFTDAELATYADVLRVPARARASSAVYRTFLLRELVPLALGHYAGERLRVPALMLTGAADPVVGPAALAGFEDHADAPARTAMISGAGHFVPEEAPEALLDALGPHLAGVAG
jgi:pimeloyl-ACP methyl ester carboxylesterase